MKTEAIKAIFTNLLFVIGVVLVILGFSRGTLTLTRLAVFGQYPLPAHSQTRCAVPQPINGEVMPKVDANCLENLEFERKTKLTDDIVNSATMLIAGAVLTISFKRFIFTKKK